MSAALIMSGVYQSESSQRGPNLNVRQHVTFEFRVATRWSSMRAAKQD